MIGLAAFLLLLAPQATAPAPGPGAQGPLFGGVPTISPSSSPSRACARHAAGAGRPSVTCSRT
ncbi:MAG: hypothetical protein DMF77_09120 [Acidobacteria bacterium]|nr:MAG: hypothetical protein DMF77_09120 [Acidobacteriota bacterium]